MVYIKCFLRHFPLIFLSIPWYLYLFYEQAVTELPGSSSKLHCINTDSSWYLRAVILPFTARSTAGEVAPGELRWASLSAKTAASGARWIRGNGVWFVQGQHPTQVYGASVSIWNHLCHMRLFFCFFIPDYTTEALKSTQSLDLLSSVQTQSAVLLILVPGMKVISTVTPEEQR